MHTTQLQVDKVKEEEGEQVDSEQTSRQLQREPIKGSNEHTFSLSRQRR